MEIDKVERNKVEDLNLLTKQYLKSSDSYINLAGMVKRIGNGEHRVVIEVGAFKMNVSKKLYPNLKQLLIFAMGEEKLKMEELRTKISAFSLEN